MARKLRTPKEDRDVVAVSLSIPRDIREAIVKAAQLDHRNLSSMVSHILSEWLKEREE